MATTQTFDNPYAGFVSFTPTSGSNFYGFVVSPERGLSRNNLTSLGDQLSYNAVGLLSQRTTRSGILAELVRYDFIYEPY